MGLAMKVKGCWWAFGYVMVPTTCLELALEDLPSLRKGLLSMKVSPQSLLRWNENACVPFF